LPLFIFALVSSQLWCLQKHIVLAKNGDKVHTNFLGNYSAASVKKIFSSTS